MTCATCGEGCHTLSSARECCLCARVGADPCALCQRDLDAVTETVIRRALAIIEAIIESCPYCLKPEAECVCEKEDSVCE